MERKLGPIGGGGSDIAEVTMRGPALQVPLVQGTLDVAGAISIGMTGTIANAGTLTSSLFQTFGMTNFVFGATLTNGGTLQLRRFIDQAGSIAIGSAVTQTLTAAAAGVLTVNDGKISQSARVDIINGGTTGATVSGFAGLMQA